jgi:tryptophan halogenase
MSWNKNVVALGLSSGFLEPLESTSIHLIQEGITELIQLFPDRDFAPCDQAEYNRRMNLNYERVRDFLLLHYVANQREGEMWRHFREMALPDSLQEKLEAWLSRAYIIKYEFGVFLPPSWIAVMLGQNLIPRGYDRRADVLPFDEVARRAVALRAAMRDAAERAPSHEDFIRQIGAASSRAPLKAAVT